MIFKRYSFLLFLLLVFMSVLGEPRSSSADEMKRGNAAFIRRDYQEAYKIWLPSAESGVAEAQIAVGFLYSFGRGVPQSHEEAVKWFRRAADQGSPDGLYTLAMAYYTGVGTPQDVTLAAQLFQRSAEDGHVGSQLMLSLLYDGGIGVEANAEKSKYWSEKARSQSSSIDDQILERIQKAK